MADAVMMSQTENSTGVFNKHTSDRTPPCDMDSPLTLHATKKSSAQTAEDSCCTVWFSILVAVQLLCLLARSCSFAVFQKNTQTRIRM